VFNNKNKVEPSYIILFSFLFLYIADKLMKVQSKGYQLVVANENEKAPKPKSSTVIVVIVMSMHSFLEGTGVGISSQYQPCLDLIIAICMHKWAEALALVMK
jgi:zinc transporter ZupT